jgi:hypothetical protein
MSTAGVVQLVIWGVVVVFIAAMFFRGWRKQVRSLRTETPEEAYRRVEAHRRAVDKLGRSRKRNLAAGGFSAGGGLWLAGTGSGWGSDGFGPGSGDSGGDGGGGCGGGGCSGGCGGGS